MFVLFLTTAAAAASAAAALWSVARGALPAPLRKPADAVAAFGTFAALAAVLQ